VRAAQVTVSASLPVPAATVWERVTTLDGVNHELAPLLRMTAPPGVALDLSDAPPGRVWLRSRLLLGGRLPVGHSDLTLLRVTPGRGFLERSPMTGMRLWQHERTIEDLPGGCHVQDRLRARTVVPVPAPLVAAVVRALFRHRHRRLARLFAETAT
jgi:hypothetical protein